MTARLALARFILAVAVGILLLYFLGPDEQSYIDSRDGAASAVEVAVSPSPTASPTTTPADVAASTVVEDPAASTAPPIAPVEHSAGAKVRRSTPIPGTTLPVGGLNGMPFAPDGLEPCDEMAYYRRQAGLPDHFDGVGFRESSCRNDVSSWCCHGFFQLHEDFWVPMPECHVAVVDDLLGNDPIDKQRNACAAAVVYAAQGGDAWDAW